MNPDTAGRPELIRGNAQLLFGGMDLLSENCVVRIKNKSYSVTAEIQVPRSGPKAIGLRQEKEAVLSESSKTQQELEYLPTSASDVRDFMRCQHNSNRRTGGPLKVTLRVNGQLFAEGTVPASVSLLFTVNDCLDIGIALGSPVSLDCCGRAPFKFNGSIEKVHVKYVTAS